MHATSSVPAAETQQRSRFQAFSALRHRNYRYYWMGLIATATAIQITMVAQPWLVYKLTGSAAYLGLVGLSQALPTIFLTMFGGVLADRVDRRRLLLWTQSGTALLPLSLALLVSTHMIRVEHLIVAGLLTGAVQAFDQPARMALLPQLIEREELTNAIALQSMAWQGTRMIGPAIGGILIATVGVAACFYLVAACVGVMLFAIAMIRIVNEASPARPSHVGQSLVEGFSFIRQHSIVSTLIGLTFVNSVFGMSYIILMPIFAEDILKAGPQGLGLLMGIGGGGALIGSTIVAFLGNYQHKGALVLAASAAFGGSLLLFALSGSFILSLAILFVSGIVNALYMTTVSASLQALVPNDLRGRIMGIYSLTWGLIPVGGMLGGGVATYTSAPVAVALGGIIVVAVSLGITMTVPQARRL